MRIKLTLSYDGTNYCGWQRQKNGISVQECVEDAIFSLTGKRVKITGSGRTDAGVHAEGQVCHFDAPSDSIPPEKYYKALNRFLPSDVKAIKSERVKDDFDACRSAKKKTYRYSVYVSDTEKPLKERYSVMLSDKFSPDEEKMKAVAKLFIGEHDFKGFMATGSSVKTTVRTIYALTVEKVGEDITFTVTGNGFLYNMVRIMVGTVLKVGTGDLTANDVAVALKEGKREKLGKTLPAKGLCLMNVEYL